MQQGMKIAVGATGVIALAISAVAFVVVRPVLAQEEATSTEATSTALIGDAPQTEQVSSVTEPIESSSIDPDNEAIESPSDTESLVQESSATGSNQVEVQLDCLNRPGFAGGHLV